MRIGVQQVVTDTERFRHFARLAEETGFAAVASRGMGVWPALCTLLALDTSRVAFGPTVLEPASHHPVLDAAAAATVDRLSPGRLFLCYGTGDGSVARSGLRPATLDQLREYVLALKGLLARGEVDYRGQRIFMRNEPTPVPVYVAGSGPKALQLAGEIGDGVIANVGLLPETVHAVQGWVAEGARAAARDPAQVPIWFWSNAAVSSDRRLALQRAKARAALAANMAFGHTLEGKLAPPELAAPLQELRRRYDYRRHGTPEPDNPNARLVDELGLTDYLLERFTIAGTPEDCRRKLLQLRKLGVTHLWVSQADLEGSHKLWKEEILPECGA